MRAYDQLRSLVSVLPPELSKGAGYVLAPADLAVLVGRAFASPEIPSRTKAMLVLTGLYTASGIDLIPEALVGRVGYVDDGLVIIQVLDHLLNETEPSVLRGLWSGDPEMLARVQRNVAWLSDTSFKHIVRPVALWLRQAIAGSRAG